MQASRIDGQAIAERLRSDIARGISVLATQGIKPGLAVILVGEDPASQVYVRSKIRRTVEVGMASFEHRLDVSVSEAGLLALISRLNADPAVDGILVQLPLPPHIDSKKILLAIDPSKDPDGFHPMNVGLISTNSLGFVPCTPLGALFLIRTVRSDLTGLDAVVVGQSNIVGKPMAQLLLGAGCTVTAAHSESRDVPALCRRADILVVAVGRPELVRGDWIKPGAIVIDVGINRIATPDGATRIVGDVAYDKAIQFASAITPVPGGVGPMTIACLLRNTMQAAKQRYGVA
jgi:methylenetetrahydrofolate dehydrogenase (NADP+)/methenyltetrahydrofolate cyclohydrolase